MRPTALLLTAALLAASAVADDPETSRPEAKRSAPATAPSAGEERPRAFWRGAERGPMREMAKFRQQMLQIDTLASEIEDAEASIATLDDPAEREFRERDLRLKRELLALREERALAVIRERAPQMLERMEQAQIDGPFAEVLEMRKEALREALEYVEEPDATLAGFRERFERSAYAPRDGGEVSALRRRLAQLEREAQVLRERLGGIEEEMRQLREDAGIEDLPGRDDALPPPPGHDPGAAPPGRREPPPNSPPMRRERQVRP
ncbi:MAG: hypothetical protein SF028_00665 [Candidatus Sumerlaeia bacterium]|nr:hypothetical protein [Candidatus Sumerlaeia bacterium]